MGQAGDVRGPNIRAMERRAREFVGCADLSPDIESCHTHNTTVRRGKVHMVYVCVSMCVCVCGHDVCVTKCVSVWT